MFVYGTAVLKRGVEFTLDVGISGYKWSDIGQLHKVGIQNVSRILDST